MEADCKPLTCTVFAAIVSLNNSVLNSGSVLTCMIAGFGLIPLSSHVIVALLSALAAARSEDNPPHCASCTRIEILSMIT